MEVLINLEVGIGINCMVWYFRFAGVSYPSFV